MSPEEYARRCARAGIPATTAEERIRYRLWENKARSVLHDAESDETRWERAIEIATRQNEQVIVGYERKKLNRDQWRAHWRSLPEYDGPPMRAPSGPVFEFVDWTGTPSQEFSDISGSRVELREAITDEYAEQRAGLLQRFAALARRGNCEYMRRSNDTAELMGESTLDLYDPPSRGGRGWCPKPAGVSQ